MARLILLDAGVVGLLCSSPFLPTVRACQAWVVAQAGAGAKVLLADLTDFEVRRELLRIRATAKLRRLDDLRSNIVPLPVNSPSWRKAAEFWAIVRRAGKPTASPDALDGDAILAGVAAVIGVPGDEVIVATTNVGHLGRFPAVDARKWETFLNRGNSEEVFGKQIASSGGSRYSDYHDRRVALSSSSCNACR